MSRITTYKVPIGGNARKRITDNLVINNSLISTAEVTYSDVVNGQHGVGSEGVDYLIYRYSATTQPTITQDSATEYSCYDTFIPNFNLKQSSAAMVGGDRITIRYRVPSDWEAARIYIYTLTTPSTRFFITPVRIAEMTGDSYCAGSLLAYKNQTLGDSVGLVASYGSVILLNDYTNPNPVATNVSWYQYLGMTYNEIKALNGGGDGLLMPPGFNLGFGSTFAYFMPGLNVYGYIESFYFGTDPNDPTQNVVNLTMVLPVHSNISTKTPEYSSYTSSNPLIGNANPNVVVISRVPV